MTDIRKTVAPKTDQLNADDLVGGRELTIKITGVKGASGKDQPISISFEGDNGKPWKPCLTMRRLLIDLWGDEAAENSDVHYRGRMVTLYRDDKVKWAGEEVGGIRIKAASHISGEKKLAVTVSKGSRKTVIIKPLQTPKNGAAPAPAKQQQSAPPPAEEENQGDQGAPPPQEERPAHVRTAQAIAKKIKATTTVADLDHLMNTEAKNDLGIVEMASLDTLKWVEEQAALHRKSLTEGIPS